MNDVTRILTAAQGVDAGAAAKLLPLLYDELRKLAAQRLSQEKPGQTLQATALVHEAYLRLIGTENVPGWESRGHFFAAAAEAMRRILVEAARRKKADKQGGACERIHMELADLPAARRDDKLLRLFADGSTFLAPILTNTLLFALGTVALALSGSVVVATCIDSTSMNMPRMK